MPLNPKSTTPDGNTNDLPQWRKQFPIESDDEASRSRREFLGGLTVAGGAMACGQAALNQFAPAEVGHGATDAHGATEGDEHVSHFPPLTLEKKFTEMTVGEAQLFHYPNEKSPCLFVKLDEVNFVSVAQKCTHLACPVIPDLESNEFHCPCHHGAFELATGEPLAGPPRHALPTVKVEIADDGTITAVGVS